ncbi:MAG: hypothetical protein KIS87_00425 [Phycisphaeraceae bacterium]|nr:hypothetical protein [Phycisphaeraceae bacterium]
MAEQRGAGVSGTDLGSKQPRSVARALAAWGAAAVVVFVVGLVGAWWFTREPPPRFYDQSSPEAVIRSAKAMVENGDARRLSELLYADGEGMRRVYARVGLMLEHLYELGVAVQARYPSEVEALAKQAREAAEEGRGASLLDGFSMRMGGPPPRGADRRAREEQMSGAIKRVFADPFGWLAESEARLGVVMIHDEMSALTWDGTAILPPVGVVVQQDWDGKWYVVPPLNLPMLSRYLPRTAEEYSIWESIVQVFNNVIVDLTKEVEAGKHASLEDLSRSAGEKAFFPAAMALVAYERAMAARGRSGGG